jgi:hypothetical protein
VRHPVEEAAVDADAGFALDRRRSVGDRVRWWQHDHDWHEYPGNDGGELHFHRDGNGFSQREHHDFDNGHCDCAVSGLAGGEGLLTLWSES